MNSIPINRLSVLKTIVAGGLLLASSAFAEQYLGLVIPKPPPKSLEVLIKDSNAIFVGIPRKFWYVQGTPHAPIDTTREVDPEYQRLRKNLSRTAAQCQRYIDKHHIAPDVFELRERENTNGPVRVYLEFELEYIAFRRDQLPSKALPWRGQSLYFADIEPEYVDKEYKVEGWQQLLGKKAVMLSHGPIHACERLFLNHPYAAPIYDASNYASAVDKRPIPLKDFERVSDIARRLGFIAMPAPKTIKNKP